MVLITPEYQKLNADLHATDPSWGNYPNPVTAQLAATTCVRYSCRSVLDYGCGKGALPEHLPSSLRIQLYDPAIEAYSAPPEPSDLVVCSAVLEHVETVCLAAVLDDLERLTQRVALLTVTTVSSSKTLGDGRNAHLSIGPIEWWIPSLAQRWTIKAIENMGPWFWFLGKKIK